jgi:hypothetical protein
MNLMLEPTLLKKSTWHPSIGLEEPLHKHLNLVIPPFLQFCIDVNMIHYFFVMVDKK